MVMERDAGGQVRCGVVIKQVRRDDPQEGDDHVDMEMASPKHGNAAGQADQHEYHGGENDLPGGEGEGMSAIGSGNHGQGECAAPDDSGEQDQKVRGKGLHGSGFRFIVEM